MPRDSRVLPEGLSERLRGPLPGLAVQLTMAPRHGPDRTLTPAIEASCLKAGVMLLSIPGRMSPHIVLTRRTSNVLHHKDEISFPGGQLEAGEDAVSGRPARDGARRSGSPGTASRSSGG